MKSVGSQSEAEIWKPEGDNRNHLQWHNSSFGGEVWRKYAPIYNNLLETLRA
jgi:hypothetical protein